MSVQSARVAAPRPTARSATAVSCFSSVGDASAFQVWAGQLLASAAAAAGHRSGRIGAVDGVAPDRSVVVSFDTEEDLHRWLDGAQRRELLAEGRRLGFERVATDVVIGPELAPGAGIGLFWHAVRRGSEDDFVVTQGRLMALCAEFPGFEGATLVAPADRGDGSEGAEEWLSMLRFRTDRQLRDWLDSTERQQVLSSLRTQLTRDFSVITRSTAFGSILRVEDGVARVTPAWKSAMLVLLVLYPTVMLLSRFLGPVLDGAGAQPWLSMWLSQIVSVGLMSFALMPAITWAFRRWLDPVQGSRGGVTAVGVVVVLIVYAATLTVFATVGWLQFWQHPN